MFELAAVLMDRFGWTWSEVQDTPVWVVLRLTTWLGGLDKGREAARRSHA